MDTSPWGASRNASRSRWTRAIASATSTAPSARILPARVSRTPRPWASTSGTPAARSAERSCWDTAEGVRYVAAATPVRVPRSASSRSSSRWRTSM